KLKLKPTIINEITTYPEKGEWISEVINIGDNFKEYGKVISTIETEEGLKTEVYTRTSENGINFNEWKLADVDNNILSQKNKFIQVKIILYSMESEYNLELDNNSYIGDYSESGDLVKLRSKVELEMIKDDSYTDVGELHKYLIKREDWNRLDKMNVLL